MLSFQHTTWSLILAGHLLGVIAPGLVLSLSASSGGLYALEAVAFVLGLCALVAWAYAAARHLARSKRNTTAATDSVFLALVFVGVASGLAMAVIHRWASVWGAAALTPYITSIGSGSPQTEYVVRMPPLVRLHVVSLFGVLAAFPFTTYATLAMTWAVGLPASVGRAARGVRVPAGGITADSLPPSAEIPQVIADLNENAPPALDAATEAARNS
jgi:nitrate reductase gamma subunit